MVLIEIIIVVGCLGYLLYKWSVKNYKVFEERGVPYKKPLPLVGNAFQLSLNMIGMHKFLLNLYRKERNNKIYGYYNFRDPIFIINDPETIKKITVKDFDSFSNHIPFLDVGNDPLLGGLLSVMKDQRWRDMRNTVSPVFTGSRMRVMFNLMNDCFDEAMKNLHSNLKPGVNGFEIEMKDFFNRLSNDLIATTAFGLKVNSFENEKNEFYTIGKSLFPTGGALVFKFLLFSIAPKLCKLLRWSLFSLEQTQYFVRLVVEAMEYREKNNIHRPDMIQLLMEAKRDSAQNWSTEDIVAQCFIFFFAAFQNNAMLLCITCYELADNPDVQQKLYEEIMETHNNLAGKTLDYDTLQEMKYLDMVVQETLRKWALAPVTDRECGRDYRVTDEDGKVLCDLKKGDKIWFPIIGLHRDEEYFEHPDTFDPERFSKENIHNIKPYTYIPFGVGPRNCIGNRYALMQAKAMLFYLLKDYTVERSPKLVKSLLDDVRSFALIPKEGFWFTLNKR